MTDQSTTAVGPPEGLADFLSALFAGTGDPIRLIFGDTTVEVADTLGDALADAGDEAVYLPAVTKTGQVAFLFTLVENAQADQWQDDRILPTVVMFKEGRMFTAYALDVPVAADDPAVIALASTMGGDMVDPLLDPLPTPGANGWEMVHCDESIFTPFETLAAAWADDTDQAVVAKAPIPLVQDHGTLNDARLLTPFRLDDPAYAQTMTVSLGSGMESKRWKPEVMPVATFIDMLSRHKEDAKKDGFCFVLAEILGDQRKKTAVKTCYGVGLDIDVGVPGRVIDEALAALGCLAVRYTTHSHGKTKSQFPKDRLIKWCDKNGADLNEPADFARFLSEAEQWDEALIASAEYIGDEQQPSGLMSLVTHAPFPKHRVVLPLSEAFEPAKVARTHADGMKMWGQVCYGVAARLGDLPFDKACIDPSRLFYFPRHAAGRPYETTIVGGTLLNWRDLDLTGDTAEPGSWEGLLNAEFAEPTKSKSKSTTDEGRALGRWSIKAAGGFQIVDLIRDHADDRIRTSGSEKIDIECPFDEEHSNAGDPEDRACFAVNAGASDAPVFTIKCQHDGCRERTNLDHLAKMIADGWFDRTAISDDAYLAEEEDGPQAVQPTRMAGGVAVNGVLDGLEGWNPKHCLFDGPNAERDAVDALSKVASVVKMGNKTRVVIRAEDGLGFSSESEAKLFFKPYRAELLVGEDKNGEPKMKWFEALDLLLKSDRRVTWKGIDCDPSNSLAPHVLNTWQGIEIAPVPGDCSLLKAHILNSTCAGDADNAHYLTQWFAHMFQRPREKPGVAPVVIGPKGCGKSTVADFVCRAIGRKHSVKIAQAKHLTGNFNAHLAGMLFCQAEEVTFGGDKKGEGPLKDGITAKTMLTEKKGLDAYQETNFTRFFLVSNPGHAVPASDGERRWFVLQALDLFEGKAMNDPGRIAYFDALYAEADAGGIAAFLDYLMNYDLTGFTPFAAPDTEALSDQKRQSFSDEDFWVEGVLETGLFTTRDGEEPVEEWEMDEPFAVECALVISSFNSHVRRFGGSSGGTGAARRALEAHGPVGKGKTSVQGGRKNAYLLGTRREWRDRWVAKFGTPLRDDG